MKVKSFWDLDPNKPREIQASYDLLTNRTQSDQWSMAQRGSAALIDTRERRQELRDLARYEMRNNPHLRGLVQKITNEVVGSGPRLSIEPRTPTERSKRAAARLEALWQEYSQEVTLEETLRVLCMERTVGGEVFAAVRANRALETVPVDLVTYEGDQVQTPGWGAEEYNNDGKVDGLVFDSIGNVVGYSLLDYHPYGNGFRATESASIMDADLTFHWYRKDRPSQWRGVSEVAPTLEVYGRLRRFIESKVQQEELRAKLMGVVKTAFAPDAGCADIGDEPIDMLIAGGQFTTMPDGWDVNLFRYETTGQGVGEFVRTCLSWATGALLVPWNVTAGDSSDYNFASGRLDYLLFYHYVDTVRKHLERYGLKWFVEKHWLPIARTRAEYPSDLGSFKLYWHWDSRRPIDEEKAARAADTLKQAELLDEVGYWLDRGEDPRDVAERNLRFNLEREAMRQQIAAELGIELPQPPGQQEQDNEQEQDTEA